MSQKKLTEAVAAATKVSDGDDRSIVWDTAVAGFGLRCSRGGSKSLVLVYRPRGLGRSGPSRTLTLGRWPELSVEAARAVARAKVGEIAHGRDPAVSEREARRAKKSTLRVALDAYEAHLRRRRMVSVPTILSSLRRGLSRLVKREVETISRADYVSAIDAVEASGRSGAADYLRKNARTFAEWAVTKGLAPHNPLAGLRRPRATRAERLENEDQARALTSAEIAALWATAEGKVHPFSDLVRLGLLTGMRRGELARLTWQDIKLDRIALAAAHTKQGRPHEIPLTKAMREILLAIPRTTSRLVFPSTKTGGPMSGWNKMLARLVRDSGVDFTLHDLRRTCRTLMSDAGTQQDIAEIAIGHQRSDLIRRYDFSDVWPQRVEAFDKVSRHISAIVNRHQTPSITIRRAL